MGARDVNKVARIEQAPSPAHEYGTISPPPPPSSTNHIDIKKNNKEEKPGTAKNKVDLQPTRYQTRHCYVKYVEYHRCIQQKVEKVPDYEKLGTYFRSLCPTEQNRIEREEGEFLEAI